MCVRKSFSRNRVGIIFLLCVDAWHKFRLRRLRLARRVSPRTFKKGPVLVAPVEMVWCRRRPFRSGARRARSAAAGGRDAAIGWRTAGDRRRKWQRRDHDSEDDRDRDLFKSLPGLDPLLLATGGAKTEVRRASRPRGCRNPRRC